VARALEAYRPLAFIEPPGTLDGGDVLRVGRTLYAGLSGRSNPAGIAQLAALAAPHGYQVRSLEVQDCLHLKSAVTQVGPGALLINRQWVAAASFDGLSLIDVAPEEPLGGNALLLGRTVVHPAACARTRRRLEAHGYTVRTVELSELEKAEGAVTCCSLIFEQTVPG
jgi:dimethylargininase